MPGEVSILAVDGGNSKTELVAASLDGELLAYVRGPGSNSHGPGGAEGTVEVVASLVERAGVELPAAWGAFYLCGADSPEDVAALEAALRARGLAERLEVENDALALLRAGSEGGDAVAVVCGAGINAVGRAADGRAARYPGLGWETGDWGGGEGLGREALYLAVRAEDGRGEPTALAAAIARHVELETATAVGEAVHYRRLPATRLGELAPLVVGLAASDVVARGLVQRLAKEVVALAVRSLRDLGLLGSPAEVVLGGGMLRGGDLLWREVVARLAAAAPCARPVAVSVPPVTGAALAALESAGAAPGAATRLRDALAAREPEVVGAG